MLTIVTSACRGTGAKVLSLELALHATAENGSTSLLIDLSHEPFNDFDMETNCLSALLLNKISVAEAYYNYRGSTSLLITRLLSSECLRHLGKSTLPHMREDVIELLIHYISRNIDFGHNVIVYVPLDYITIKILTKMFVNPFLKKYLSVVVVANEKKHCINTATIQMLQKVGGINFVKGVIFNRIPMGLVDTIRDEILRSNVLTPFIRNKNSFISLILPLTRQLYYRDLFGYVPLLMKAKDNDHARTISTAMRKLLRVVSEEEKEKLLIGVIRGMLNVVQLREPTLFNREAEALNRMLAEVPWE